MAKTKKQLSKRLSEVKKALSAFDKGAQSRSEAASSLGISEKSFDRLRANPPTSVEDLVHGNTGRRPAHALREAVELAAVEALRRPEYEGLGPTMAQEVLEDYHGIVLSKETARKIMRRNGLWKAGRAKSRSLHLLRPPRPRRGELVQADGCLHNWFGEGKSCLMIFVDDATSELLSGRLEPFECGLGYARAYADLVGSHGIPMAAFVDRHSIFGSTPKAGERPSAIKTMFAAMLSKMGTEVIYAWTPEAKGRVERMNQTLQKRLTAYLRMEGVSTIDQANEALPRLMAKINAKFAKAPKAPESAFVAWTGDRDALNLACSLRETRKFAGNSASFRKDGVLYQPTAAALAKHGARRLAGAQVDYCQRLDGTRCLLLAGTILPHDEFEADRVPMAANSKELDPEFERVASASAVKQRQAQKAAREALSQKRLELRRRLDSQGFSRREIFLEVDKIT